MRLLLFLSRVAFICNLFFILCLFIRYTHLSLPESLNGFIIIVGWILSVIMNVLANVVMVYIDLYKQKLQGYKWLYLFNLFCLLFQSVYFLV
jgi:hypothetical protein